VLLALLGLVSQSAIAAGFDCAQASHTYEKLVCTDNELSANDARLNALYKTVLERIQANDRADVTSAQRAWVADVRNACGDRACLSKVYDKRIQELSRIDENTAYVVDSGELHQRVVDFQANLQRTGSPMSLDGCQAMIRIGTSAERSYGAYCRTSGRTILLCDDTMVGKLTVSFQPPGSSQQLLVDFTKGNCPPSG